MGQRACEGLDPELLQHIRECPCPCDHMGYGNYLDYQVKLAIYFASYLAARASLQLRLLICFRRLAPVDFVRTFKRTRVLNSQLAAGKIKLNRANVSIMANKIARNSLEKLCNSPVLKKCQIPTKLCLEKTIF